MKHALTLSLQGCWFYPIVFNNTLERKCSFCFNKLSNEYVFLLQVSRLKFQPLGQFANKVCNLKLSKLLFQVNRTNFNLIKCKSFPDYSWKLFSAACLLTSVCQLHYYIYIHQYLCFSSRRKLASCYFPSISSRICICVAIQRDHQAAAKRLFTSLQHSLAESFQLAAHALLPFRQLFVYNTQVNDEIADIAICLFIFRMLLANYKFVEYA